jgi:hypothetical protein
MTATCVCTCGLNVNTATFTPVSAPKLPASCIRGRRNGLRSKACRVRTLLVLASLALRAVCVAITELCGSAHVAGSGVFSCQTFGGLFTRCCASGWLSSFSFVKHCRKIFVGGLSFATTDGMGRFLWVACAKSFRAVVCASRASACSRWSLGLLASFLETMFELPWFSHYSLR